MQVGVGISGTLRDFFATENRLMTNDSLRKTMADYHDLVDRGRREISIDSCAGRQSHPLRILAQQL
jgi:hypothetical protein